MTDFVVYDVSGKILRIGYCNEDEIEYQSRSEDEFTLAGTAGLDTHYVISGVLTAKASCPATISSTTITADGVDTILIDNIPIGTTATIVVPEGAASIDPIIINDGDLDFTCVVTGTYTFTLTSNTYLTKTLTLTAI